MFTYDRKVQSITFLCIVVSVTLACTWRRIGPFVVTRISDCKTNERMPVQRTENTYERLRLCHCDPSLWTTWAPWASIQRPHSLENYAENLMQQVCVQGLEGTSAKEKLQEQQHRT